MTIKLEKIKDKCCQICFKNDNVFYFRVGNIIDTPIITICICEDCYKKLVGKMTKGE